ncbi:hypothetical protein P154DRAFT_526531 [Amniculicola lignicola CBS 123094]|uniref:Phosphoglycerate mutase-like protein n=1 Tax=Amniculicola lignicola CBS 123094 TaxID=1392246 RepID=A0A6A5W1U1_9PLEO|nr:hypothetical protein P154DRAFT_526531 [Amniculicola lignicola CBS 123094]
MQAGKVGSSRLLLSRCGHLHFSRNFGAIVSSLVVCCFSHHHLPSSLLLSYIISSHLFSTSPCFAIQCTSTKTAPPENNAKPCDTGSPIAILAAEFPQFDFSTVDPLFPDKTSNPDTNPYVFTRRAILARAQTCLRALYSRPEKVIAVVSHSGFLRSGVSNKRYFNADWRVFEYDENALKESKERGEGVDGQGTFVLKEWKETEENGGGMGKSEKGFFPPIPRDFPVEVGGEATVEEPGSVA